MRFRTKIDWAMVYLFFCVMPYLKPYNVTLIPWADNIFKLWKVLASLCILLTFIKGKPTFHRKSIYLIIFCAIWMISLVLNNGPVGDYFNNILSIIGITLLFEKGYKSSKFKSNITLLIYEIGAIYMLLTLITAIQTYPFFAYGMKLDDNANFLGGDNYSAFILIVLCGCMFFYDEKYKRKIRKRTWLFSLLGLVSLIIPCAVTGILSYSLLLLVIVLRKYPGIRKLFKWKYMVLICLLVVLAISYFGLDAILAKILNSMDKTGFNGRNMIWPMTISAIVNKPLLGYGGLTETQAQTWMIAGANHAHNILLQYPFSVGIVGTMFFVLYVMGVLNGTKRKCNKHIWILMTCLSAFVFCSIFDFYIGLIYFYLLLEMIWIHKDSDVKEKNDEEKRCMCSYSNI